MLDFTALLTFFVFKSATCLYIARWFTRILLIWIAGQVEHIVDITLLG